MIPYLGKFENAKIIIPTDLIRDPKIEGRTEEKNEIALKLLKNGVSIDIISNATGLPLDMSINYHPTLVV
jgi:hypothetical protein